MHWDLLDRYLTDSCNSEERDEVERWLAESAGRRRVLEQIAEALDQGSPEALKAVRNQLVQDLGLERDAGDSSYKPKPKPKAKERGKEALGRGVNETPRGAKKEGKSPKPTTRSAEPKPKKPGGGRKKPR